MSELKIKKILGTYFDADFEDDANMKACVKELVDLVKSSTKSAPSSGASKAKASKTSDETSEKATRPYSQFVRLCSTYNKNKMNIELPVIPGDYYKKKDTTSYKLFEEELQDLVGQEMTFHDMFTIVHEKAKNVMKTTGVCWGLLDKDTQTAILAELP